jgi:hypothetical protein
MQKEKTLLELEELDEAITLKHRGNKKTQWYAKILGIVEIKECRSIYLDRKLSVTDNTETLCGYQFSGAISTILTKIL